VACEVVLVAPQREAAGPDGLEDLRFLHSFANATGAHFARPGAGPAGALHRRRFAAPGRVLASAVPGASAAGALGMLALPACALGRDADWRRLEAAQQGFDTHVSLDLSLVRPVRAESPRVRVAPYVEDEDVLGLARCVAHSGLRPGVSLEIVVPGRASLAVWT